MPKKRYQGPSNAKERPTLKLIETVGAIVLWQIRQSTQIMKDFCKKRELLSRHFIRLSDKESEGKGINVRARPYW